MQGFCAFGWFRVLFFGLTARSWAKSLAQKLETQCSFTRFWRPGLFFVSRKEMLLPRWSYAVGTRYRVAPERSKTQQRVFGTR
jgi:hypothetical protein